MRMGRLGRIVVQGVLPLVVLAVAVAIALYLMRSTPSAQRESPPERRAQLVEVTRAEREDRRVTITAWGTVEAAREVDLRARVGGEVVEVSPKLRPGGQFDQGERVLRIDASDYRLALRQAESDLARAKADLEIEKGNRAVARQEYELLGEDIPGANKDLILREPQMDTARADIASAEARVRQARLDLQRTTVNAPFDGKVVSEDVDLGTNLSTQDRIARLVGTDRYWVELAVPAAQLRWIDAAETEGTEGSPVILRNPSVWPSNATRRGVVREVLPDLSDRGRMARLLVEVRDPLAREPETAGKPGLLLGAYLRAEVRGRVLRDVVAVEREHLRQDDTVWIMNETDALEIRAVQIVYRGNDEVYVDAGVSDGERIVTSPIPSAAAGMPLRTREPQA